MPCGESPWRKQGWWARGLRGVFVAFVFRRRFFVGELFELEVGLAEIVLGFGFAGQCAHLVGQDVVAFAHVGLGQCRAALAGAARVAVAAAPGGDAQVVLEVRVGIQVELALDVAAAVGAVAGPQQIDVAPSA